MGTNTAFVLTSLAGWLAAFCAELCHESRRQVLLPRRPLCTRRLLQSHAASQKDFQPITGGKEMCLPTTKNHCGLSNFSGIAMWTSFTPSISSLWVTQQSKDSQFVPVGCSVKAWINGFYVNESWRFKTWDPHSYLRSRRRGYARTCLGSRDSSSFSLFLPLALWGTTQTILSTSVAARASTGSLHLSARGKYRDGTCANKGHRLNC